MAAKFGRSVVFPGSSLYGGLSLARPALAARLASGSGSPLPEMPPCDFKPRAYEGYSYDKTKQLRKEHLNPGMTLTFYSRPVLIHQGYMQWLFDHEGKRYLDLFAGIVTVSVGHCHPKVTARAQDQLSRLWHTTNIYMHPNVHEYAEKLTARLPGNLKVVYFTNSGSEANDLALLMARLYTGAFDAITLRNSYHGASPYAGGLTAIGTWKYQLPLALGIHNSVNADVFRGPWGGANCRDSLGQTLRKCDCSEGTCQASEMYAEQVKDLIVHSCPKKIAAFFAEVIQGVGGAMQLPKYFLKAVYEIVRERGGLCVSDEVQTGFGRLGSHYWGFETQDVQPDVVSIAKGMGNGFPMGAVITTPEVAETMGRALHFNTFGGNPVACAIGSAVLDVIDEDRLQENSRKVGEVFMKELIKLRDEFEVVGDVRGKGLMIGVEMVKNKKTREPLPIEDTNWIWEACKDYGVLLGKGGLYGTCFRIKPPMCVTEEDVMFASAVMRKVLQEYEMSKK